MLPSFQPHATGSLLEHLHATLRLHALSGEASRPFHGPALEFPWVQFGSTDGGARFVDTLRGAGVGVGFGGAMVHLEDPGIGEAIGHKLLYTFRDYTKSRRNDVARGAETPDWLLS
jgi:hypothetical protein